MKKRFFAMALVVVMSLTMLPLSAGAAFSPRSTDPGLNNTTYTSGNPYPKKQCTWYAWGRYKELCGIALPSWGNAENWYSKAKSAGYAVGDEPKLGAIACWDSWNHVAIVEKIEGGNIYVSQYNRQGKEKFGGLDKNSNGSEKKDASGKNIWTSWEMMGVKGSRKGKAGGTPSHYIYLKEEATPVQTTITFDLVTPPSFTVGTDIDLDGSISASGSKINSVMVEILDAGSSVMMSASSSGNFSVQTYGPLIAKKSKLNSDLDLSKLPAGDYYARFTAGTQDGTSESHLTGLFTVRPISCSGNHTKGTYLFHEKNHPHYAFWVCSVCGEKFSDGSTKPLDSCEICSPPKASIPNCDSGHTFSSWAITKAATCGIAGEQQHKCSLCGKIETQPLPALEHDYQVNRSTSTEKVYTCSYCGDTYTVDARSDCEKDGHRFGSWEIVQKATCGSQGQRQRICTVCRQKENDPIPATGLHNYDPKSGICYDCGATRANKFPFGSVNFYYDGLFTDVGYGDWFYLNVATAYELGLMKGTGSETFSPGNNMTLAEAITLAARIHKRYNTGSEDFPSYDGGNWYDPYVDYARENGIVSTYYDHTRPATREQFVHILAQALPKSELADITGGILFADSADITYAADVELLSRAGVINGVSENGQVYFKPWNTITRAEVAAVVGRMVQPDTRIAK